MKKYIYILAVVAIFGCSANPRYAGTDSRRQVHRKYTTKMSKAEVKRSIDSAGKLDLQAGARLNFVCSYYGEKFHGRSTSNGEKYDMNKLTAAHKTLPFNTKLRVTNPDNGKSVVVRINDRGPFVAGRDLDLSQAAAQQIEMIAHGVKELQIEVLELGK
ncbi:MAG: septal ring lytic transglycosylase RlpA family protein [Candidatus Cloacimonadales bacterium]